MLPPRKASPAAAVLFQACRQDRHAGAEFAVDYFAEALDLAIAQRGKLERIKGELFAERAAMRAVRERAYDEITALLTAETLDVDRLAAFHATLTAEQKAKLVDRLEKLHRLQPCASGRTGAEG